MDKLYLLPGIIFGLVFHEFCHGYAAYRLGDPTARDAGRLSLNPLKHLDLLGTACLIFFRFGWAKPVPFNPYYFKNPRQGTMITAIAGPASNLLLAAVLGIITGILFNQVIAHPVGYQNLGPRLLYAFVFNGFYINIVLAMFNLIPIPPLDGSHIIWGLLPAKAAAGYGRFLAKHGRWVAIAFMVLLVMGPNFGIPIFSWILMPPLKGLMRLFSGHSLEELWTVYLALGGFR